ncbi:carboxymuconolactone decarboxylase family protein [Chitinophaga sedimenti]|uniref:carboxymuconolactone decarboxylase family protein n=1 Tax=Chitinophaga sedimenti TaxID=2033606 RepID=UPI00200509EA|nr:carboxymuconolactone decarboxylase family protein [Chitinophaga sedimenti]MCK7556575.1 carboxymuconolactone decarboxylase family protein [Chitinophaga sedimenti]
MTTRISFQQANKGYMDGLLKTAGYLKQSTIDAALLELLHYRVSQINGCAYCPDMAHKDATAHGETAGRLYGLAAWREFPWYSEKERAALAYAEAITRAEEIDDALYAGLQQFFSVAEIADLALYVSMTNLWNRLNKTFRTEAGTYQPGAYKTAS